MKRLIKIIIGFFAVLAVAAQTAWAEENPFTSRAFWAEMKQTENWQEIVQSHIDQGWDITEIDPKYGTALHNAVSAGFSDALLVLMNDYNLDVNVPTLKSKYTPLHYVASFAKDDDGKEVKATAVKMAEILVNAGADMSAIDWNGETPLHEAFAYGSIESINYLIEAGADQTIVDNNNKTPFQMIQVGRGRPVLGSLFYTLNKNKFTDDLRLVWGKWDKGKRILQERKDGKLITFEEEN